MPTASTVLPFRSRDLDTASDMQVTLFRGQPDTVVSAPVIVASVPRASGGQIVPLQDLGNGRCFIHPLYVFIDRLDDECLATSNDLALIGRGTAEFEAMDDLREQVAELYESLDELRDDLGAHLTNQLAFLDRLAGKR